MGEIEAVKTEQGGPVTIETPRPLLLSHQQRVLPGVVERTTCKLLVRYQMDFPPVFDPAATRWTGITREFGYTLVGALEKIRTKLPMMIEQPIHPQRPGRVRLWLRHIREVLAVSLLLPEYKLLDSSDVEHRRELSPLGFEASRRLFEVQGDGFNPLLVCHVLAERHGDASERLLNEFALLIEDRRESPSLRLEDEESDLCLYGRQTNHFGRRQYWEILIGAAARFPAPELVPPIEIERSPEEREGRDTGARPKAKARTVEYQAAPMPAPEFLKGLVERSKVDWSFVVAEIKRAETAGEELDEAFVQRLARQRYQHTQSEFPEEQPGATLETSVEVVRDILAMHLEAKKSPGAPSI